MTDKIADALRRRADTMNGARPVGAGDGQTYAVGYYDSLARKVDVLAAAALDAQDKRIAELEAALQRADEVIGPFAKEADQWDASVSDAYRPGVTEPGHSQAHANAEFSIGDLRAALAWKEGEALMALPAPPSRLLNKEDRNG